MAEPAAEASMSSPLSGGYLLIILAEPHSQEHKQILLQRLAKGRKKNIFFLLHCVYWLSYGGSEPVKMAGALPPPPPATTRRNFALVVWAETGHSPAMIHQLCVVFFSLFFYLPIPFVRCCSNFSRAKRVHTPLSQVKNSASFFFFRKLFFFFLFSGVMPVTRCDIVKKGLHKFFLLLL